MNESKILRTACDAKWYAHAYSEYLADVAESTSNLMSAIQDMLSRDEANLDTAVEILYSHEIHPSSRFIIGEYGPIEAYNLLMKCWVETESSQQYDSRFPYSVEEALSIIRGSWTQCVIGSKAFESYNINIEDPINRVTKFKQDIEANFSIDESVRDTVAYYQSMINASPNVRDFVNLFIVNTGVDDADNSDDPMSYVNSNLYQYTGNTPGLSLDFSTVTQAVNSTIRVAAKAVKGVFNLIGQGVSWLFNKTKKYVVDTVIDPAVCEYVGNDETNDGYIDGFAWYGEFTPEIQYSMFTTTGQITSVFANFHDKYAEKWIKIKLKMGEFLFRIVSDAPKWQCYFKPAVIDVDYFAQNYTGSVQEPQYTAANHYTFIEEYNTWLAGVMEYIQPVSKDATKEQIYRGLAFSTGLISSIAMFAFAETFGIVEGSNAIDINNSYSRLVDLSEYYTFTPASDAPAITNRRILLAAAGNPDRANNIHYSYKWDPGWGITSFDNDNSKRSIRTVMTNIISIWALCRKERELYPIDYTFVPYSNNHTSFSQPSWKIKSDMQIAETRDNFIENVIVAAIAITAIVFISATAIKISKRAFFRRQQTLGQLENKMWNGGKLTAAERRKYIKYTKRQNASRWLSTGSNDPTSSLSNDNQAIINLIQG